MVLYVSKGFDEKKETAMSSEEDRPNTEKETAMRSEEDRPNSK